MSAGSQRASRSLSVKPLPPAAETGSLLRGKHLLLLACFLAMSFCAAKPSLWPWFVSFSTVAAGLVLLTSYRGRPKVRDVLILAVLLRLILLPLMPSLSDDGYRYIWDGLLQVHGINPYLFRPDAPSLADFHSLEVYSHLNSAGYFSVYPPLSQMIFWLSSWIAPNSWPLGFLLIKLVVTTAEIGSVFLLSTLVEPRKLVLYAWNPLVVVEVAGQGHGEGLVAALLITTLWALKRSRPKTAIAAVTGAAWVKLYPILLLPFVLRRTGWRNVWLPVAISVVVLAPYAAPGVVSHIANSVDLYFRLFEFNSGPYLALKWLGYLVIGVQGLEHVLGHLLGIAFLLFVARVYMLDRARESDLSSAMSLVAGGFLVLATTVHPWYLVPVMALTPFMGTGAVAWLWLATTSTATYLFYSNGIYWPFVWAGWTGVALVGAWIALPRWKPSYRFVDSQLKSRALEKVRRIRRFLPEMTQTCEVLDLGAGEGYVGEILEQKVGFKDHESGFEIPGCQVILCDVRNANRTDLPYTVYGGGRLPFADNSFDATLLIFVLHHTEAPAKVIQEARRVTRRRIIIIESVYEGMIDRAVLRFLDRFVNRIRSRGEMAYQEKWLRFRTVDEWITLIERDGGVIQSIRRWGRYHKQALFVIDCKSSGPRREFMVQSVGKGF